MSYYKFFTKKERPDGKSFVCCTDDVMSDLKDFVRKVHEEFEESFPSDWLYEIIKEAFEDLENDSIDDITFEGDIYHNDLAEWLKERYAQDFVNEAIAEFGFKNVFDAIRAGQAIAKEKVYQMVEAFMTCYPFGEER